MKNAGGGTVQGAHIMRRRGIQNRGSFDLRWGGKSQRGYQFPALTARNCCITAGTVNEVMGDGRRPAKHEWLTEEDDG
jgi:hypothetical protein